MKATTAIGIALACILIALGAIMEGTQLTALINIPASLFVFGGTFGAVMAGTSFERVKAIPRLYQIAIKGEEPDPLERIELMARLAEIARREGLLALEAELDQIRDRFTRKGIQMVVDGTDPEVLREVLEIEIEALEQRHGDARRVFEKAAGFAPTMGILGTVLGLVHVLQNLDDPGSLGPAISSAFIATLFGVGSANVVFFPVANRLKELTDAEVRLRIMTLDAVLAVLEGENPRVLREKLVSFLPPELADQAAAGAQSSAGRASAAGAPAGAPAAEPVAA
ncbi:flagellar motor protein [Thermoleophilum album]|jgi:chemotaxis protein MotA|uniref:flagellar motor protein n=1 Tax=Thermoleophilum album TaxID=29539 RepID=UPI00237CCD8E|nr:flagellar motor protein [Thermoleophilum album]WDT94572.1 flagellar motor protein [Thermoleophilum album]